MDSKQTKDYDVTVESGIIAIFQSQSYKLERIFAEFIDNSLQSYIDHEEHISKMPDGEKCKIDIIWNDEFITIIDNSYGMDDDEFGRALKLKAFNPRAAEKNRLSVYGMGLKYASVYLGDHYQINSTRYGEDIRRIADVDVPYFAKNNPKKVSAELYPEDEQERGTEIKITSLRIKRTDQKEKDLREKLGIIYNHYIRDGKISISINKIPVKYTKPELRKKDDGSKYFEKFEGAFDSDGIQYTYSGWIGILQKGDQSITGINLTQASRCIQLGWNPEAIFGKGNSFQNSRVVGEIVFSGEHSILSYDKDKFVWSDNGTEDKFIEQLLNTPQFSYIIKTCKKLKKTSDKEKIITKSQSMLNISGVTEEKNTEEPASKNPVTSTTETHIKTEQNNSNQTSSTSQGEDQSTKAPEVKYPCYKIDVNSRKVPLYVDMFEGTEKQDWIKLEAYKNGYCLHINFKNEYIINNFPNQTSIVASNSMAIVLATSILQAQESGVKLSNSLALLESINKVMSGGDKDAE